MSLNQDTKAAGGGSSLLFEVQMLASGLCQNLWIWLSYNDNTCLLRKRKISKIHL